MNNYSGKLIVIDGTDGSGKTTQLNLLKNKLEAEGYEVMVADFPQYNQKSAGLVEEYLSGKYGQAEEITPYQASIFYAADRYDASFKIRSWLKDGKIVLANRYTSANIGHQGCKIDNPLERQVFFNWLYDLEYKIFNVPKPDLSLILHVDPTIAQQLAKQRSREDWNGKTTDIHEENLNHLKKASEVYLEIASTLPDFKLIKCSNQQGILSREEIHFLIWLTVSRVLGQNETTPKNAWQPIKNIISTNQQIINNRETLFSGDAKTTDSETILTKEISSTPALSENTATTTLIIEKLNPHAKLPQKAHVGDAGYDLYANEYYSISPYNQTLVATGIRMAIPDGYVGLIWDKSGIAFGGIKIMGGVIDSNYRGEIKVIVKNLSEEIFNIIPGQKIAQILIQAIGNFEVNEGEIQDQTTRADNGFGSSGKF